MDRRQQAGEQLKFVRMFTSGLIEEFPTDRYLYQPGPGANHLLWQIGHLANSTNWAAGLISADVPRYPEELRGPFGGGSVPMAEESAYPPFDRIRAMFDETHQTLLALLESTPDKVLDEPLPAEAAYAAPNKFGMFAFTAWHEGFHAGQIATLRKSLGLKPKFA